MYKLTRMWQVLSKAMTAVQPATTVMKLQYDTSIWYRLRLDGSPTRLCTNVAEDMYIPSSGKILANAEEKQLSYNRKASFNLNFPNDSATDSSISSDYSDLEDIKDELKARAMAEEAETQNEILPEYKEGERYNFFPNDSATDFSSDYSDDGEAIRAAIKARAMAEAEIQYEILPEYKEGERYCYNPNIKYKPLKRYDVPRFAFSDDSSTDTENETMAEEVSPTQKDLAGTREKLLN